MVQFTNGYTVTVEGTDLFAPVHNSVIDAFQRQVMSLFRVGEGVTSTVVDREEG